MIREALIRFCRSSTAARASATSATAMITHGTRRISAGSGMLKPLTTSSDRTSVRGSVETPRVRDRTTRCMVWVPPGAWRADLSGRVLREIAAVVRVAIAEERTVVAVEHDAEHRRGIELVERSFEQLARRLVRRD